MNNNSNSKVDDKLITNIIDETKRLESQLKDLEEYKTDYEAEEYEQIKSETLSQLVENAKLLSKFTSGDLKTTSVGEEARKKIAETISENYNLKDLLNTFLSSEVYYLRHNLKKVINQYSIGKISFEDYQHSIAELLALISKNSELNEEEIKLNEEIKNKSIMNKYSKDEGLSKDKIESSLKK